MFTNNKAKYFGDNKVLIDAACLSGDTKPTTGVANGSMTLEMDTGKLYAFDEANSEWLALSSGGGGGGGTEPLIVTVDAETDALNYTWREILDACLEGRNIILASVNSDGDGQWVTMTTIEKYPSTNEYLVSFGSAASYTASSENEYPAAD